MRQSKILLDTCSYLRLAKSIHPLLNQTFGEENYCLYITEEVQKEYDKSPRLQTKFEWVNDLEFIKNRKKPIQISRTEKKEIERIFNFILYEASENISKPDIRCLSYAYVLKIPIVTDDGDMIELAKEYKIKSFSTLEILKLMRDSKHISMDKVRSTVSYWSYLSDLPMDINKLRREYKNIFMEKLPEITL